MTERLADDERGLATGLIVFFGILVLAGLLVTFMNPIFDQSDSTLSNQTTTTQAQDNVDSAMTVWQNLLFYPIFLGALMLIARAVFESRRP